VAVVVNINSVTIASRKEWLEDMSLIKKKAIIFDVDETLVDRKDSFIRFCNYLLDRYGKDYPYDGTREALIDYMVGIDENGYGGLENFIPRLSKLWKLPLTIEEFMIERNEVFGKMTTPYPELYEVLEALKGKYKLGIITNGYSSVQRDKIHSVHIADYFDDIIVSGEHGFAKPDSRIFELSLKRLGVTPEEAVYIGDYYPNDIAGAIGANIQPIWICEDPEEQKEYDGIRINRLKDILNYFL
jgi:putative hydrolase of the HAD superfamily